MIIISSIFSYDFFELSIKNVDRATGLYSNPNRAGLICCVGQAISYCLLFLKFGKNNYGKYFLIFYFICLLGAFLTFSKSAIIISILLAVTIFFYNKKLKTNTFKYFPILKKTIITLGIIVFVNIVIILDSLSLEQLTRYYELIGFLSGEINEATTTKRSVIISTTLEKISDNWLFGSGINVFNDNVFYGTGTQNEFLAMWGNYGVLGLVGYLFYFLVWILSILGVSIKKNQAFVKYISLSLLIIIFLSSMVSHTVVSSKQFSFVIGLVFGIYPRYKSEL